MRLATLLPLVFMNAPKLPALAPPADARSPQKEQADRDAGKDSGKDKEKDKEKDAGKDADKGAEKDAESQRKPRVELPAGWRAEPLTDLKLANQFASNAKLGAYFMVTAEPKQDFADSIDLLGWAKRVKKNATAESQVENRKETELTQGKIGERPTVEYEITGEYDGVKLHYRIIMVQVGDWYVKLTCWTTPSHWKAARAEFEPLVTHLK